MTKKSIACFLGAGYSAIARVPLARDLFRSGSHLVSTSEAQQQRFAAISEHYENWQQSHPGEHAEQYLSVLYASWLAGGGEPVLGEGLPPWQWAVEYVAATIASAGTPPGSLNRNPRYSNRTNRPLGSDFSGAASVYSAFWAATFNHASELSILTTNYDTVAERLLRHRPMQRPRSPGCFYGGLPRPQWLKGASQPFSRFGPENLIEMTGAIPIYKLHGSLSWSWEGGELVLFQDMRAAFRGGGNAAITPPIPEKSVPDWLEAVWFGAGQALRKADVWVICGYSAPPYDVEVGKLLTAGVAGRPIRVVLMSPNSSGHVARWHDLAPEAEIVPIQGLPDGIEALDRSLK